MAEAVILKQIAESESEKSTVILQNGRRMLEGSFPEFSISDDEFDSFDFGETVEQPSLRIVEEDAMDSMFRLFCGCCGLQSSDSDPPYSQLREDSVTPVRDPPIQRSTRNAPQRQPVDEDDGPYGFNNEPFVFEAPDGHGYRDPVQEYVNNGENMNAESPPPMEMNKEKTKEEIAEKAAYDDIIESTQHSIIAIGQTETVEAAVGMEIHYRERAYKEKAKKMSAVPAKTDRAPMPETYLEFEFMPTQTPLEVPLQYDMVSATIEPSPIERMPFSCPDFNQIIYARAMGNQNPMFLPEHPDHKNAGNYNGCLPRQKVAEILDEIHQAVNAVEIEPKQDLIVSMDF